MRDEKRDDSLCITLQLLLVIIQGLLVCCNKLHLFIFDFSLPFPDVAFVRV